jgi:mono/diheme cytochrome c family protein
MKAAGMVALTLNSAEMQGLVSYLASLKGTAAGSAATPPASAAPAPAAAKAQPSAAAGTAKTPTGSPAGDATAAQGKGIFDSQRCSGCHGQSGGGGVGPALTHISSQYPPAKLTALLKAPTAKMKAAGMVPLTLNSADMEALVSYVTGLGGTPAGSAATPAAAGSSASAPAKAGPGAAARLSPAATKGRLIFKAHGCEDCHGTDGFGGTAAAPGLAGTGKSFAPALLTTILQHPTARMQKGGMPPISLSSDELKALVAYVSSISASKGNRK